jgi:tRNA C32,U32 (ribose-2'-O)-methylase TrmJ
MLTNATYNLMEAAAVLSKGLYRYEVFKKDSQACQQCQQIWDQMRTTDEEQLALLVSRVREHLDHEQVAERRAAA